MYFSLNQEKIVFHQNNGITVRINGPEDLYYVEVREFLSGKNQSFYLDGYPVCLSGKEGVKTEFNLPIRYYGDLETTIYKYIDGKKSTRVFTHRYNDYGKLVRFKFDTESVKDSEIWYDLVMEYKKIYGCKVVIDSPFDHINKRVNNNFELIDIDYYKTYYIGRYPKVYEEWNPKIPHNEGVRWKKLWSFEHPRNWVDLSPEEIGKDILGL
jgi:hypothetical protein